MKKGLYIMLFGYILMCFVSPIYAKWYGNFQERITYGVTTNCETDGTIDSPGPNNNDGGPLPGDNGLRYTIQSRVIEGMPFTTSSANAKRSMTCERWDPHEPIAMNISYHNDWTNDTNIRIDIQASDQGGSIIQRTQANISFAGGGWWGPTQYYELKQYTIRLQEMSATDTPIFSQWSSWHDVSFQDGVSVTQGMDSVSVQGTLTVSKSGSHIGTAYKYRFQICDGAGNCSKWREGTDVYKLDTVQPKIGFLLVRPSNPNQPEVDSLNNNEHLDMNFNTQTNNFLAGREKPIEMVYRNTDGAPITVMYCIEDDEQPSMCHPRVTGNFKYQFRLPEKFTKVDNDLKTGINGRQIMLKIVGIRDQAGNMINIPSKEYAFYVFADILNVKPAINERPQHQVADGSKHIYTQVLVDNYGNHIIPASRIGRTLSRYTQTQDNAMYLNQQTREGETSVYVNDEPLPLISGNQMPVKDSQDRVNGKYQFTVQVYTPTANAYTPQEPVSDPKAKFSFSSWLRVKDDQSKIWSVAQKDLPAFQLDNPIFQPLFRNKIIGNLRDGGFIEGAIQYSQINTKKEVNSLHNVPLTTFINYSGATSESFDLFSPKTRKLFPRINTNFFTHTLIAPQHMSPLETFLKQKPNQVNELSNIQLSTHFSYTINNKNVLYNGDVIGKNSYFDEDVHEVAKQVGVKILGNANNKNLNFLLSTQNADIDNIITANIVQDVRNEIRESISFIIRNISLTRTRNEILNVASALDTNTVGYSVVRSGIVHHGNDASVLLIEGNGQIIKLSAQEISGKRTVVGRGVHIYITNDMYYKKNTASTLGIAVLKNEQGQGGNVYIDPLVTNIVGVYMTEGAIMSYDGSNEINVGDISVLKNQLHIFGSLITQNTIGGSRKDPLKCPVSVAVNNCTTETAQKYDLNFLRRYYLYQNMPFGNGKTIGQGEVQSDFTVKYPVPSGLIHKFNNTSDELAKYPVIIEHDGNLLINPPFGFEKFRK